jgi:ribonuclease P protein component
MLYSGRPGGERGRSLYPPPACGYPQYGAVTRAQARLTPEAQMRILPRPFFDQCILLFLVRISANHGAAHEAPLSTEQPASQEDPRLPCAHGHEGRSTRPEPSSSQGPQATVGLTAREPVSPAPAGPLALPRGRRLTTRSEFDRVHRQGSRSSDALFLVIATPNGLAHARLGTAVAVRTAGNAVKRNRLKRAIRESFRASQHALPAVDIVVNARAAATGATSRELSASLARHWQRVRERCA